MTIEQRLSRARTRMLLDYPWFGNLSMRIRVESKPKEWFLAQGAPCATFCVDGTSMFYNPEFAATLTDDELVGVFAHEVCHCAFLHMFRRGARDPEDFNIAADYVVNAELIRAGFTLPKDVYYDKNYLGMGVETVYAQIHDPNKKKKGKNGGGKGASTGVVLDAPQPGDESGDGKDKGEGKAGSKSMSESDWQVAVEQATNTAKACGNLPAGIAVTVQKLNESTENWKATLREFISNTVPSDYSWTSPNRRHIANNIYLPGMVKENIGKIAVAVDTSGSISDQVLAAFTSELNAIAHETKPEGITVLYCDTQVNKVEEFSNEDEIELHAVGRGGTSFIPVFDAISKWDEKPVCLLYFTDLECGDVPEDQEYPTLWVTGINVTRNGPSGRTIRIDASV